MEKKFSDFKTPTYNQRDAVSAGTNHGTGKPQPVGVKKASNREVIPMGVKIKDARKASQES